MIILKMLLSRNQIIKIVFVPLVFIVACGEPEKREAYIARVNNSYLTEAEFSVLVDSQFVSEKSKASVIKNWVRQEILFQEAVKQGITETAEFRNTIENSKRQLAAALVLNKLSGTSHFTVTDEELSNYFEQTKTSYRLPFNSYFLNRITFTSRESAVMFRSEVIQFGWKEAVGRFSGDTSLVNISGELLLSEQDVYPVSLLRMLEGLYPLEISIVVQDDKGYYSVVQLLDKYQAQSVPPFIAVKMEVEKRYKDALTEVAIENYIKELYSISEIEINH